VDAAGGSVVAVVAVALAIWFVGLNLAAGPFPALARQIRGSAVVRGLDNILPPPPSLLAQVRRFLDRFGFPEVFAGLPPAPGGAVRGPSQAQANRAFREAAHSTVRIVGRGCGGIQEGSGFVVSPHYVVTNAHVVAGVRNPLVQIQNGGSGQPGVPVLFDPEIDIAVLRVADQPGPVLSLVPREVNRGAVGAVVGYPGGGTLTGVAAANRRVLTAVGKDIYGKGTVDRDIYELQSTIRPGNSGGPFVLVDGKVAGVVFAASTADSGIGYAITSTEARPDIDRGVGRGSGVSTGPCTR
jgi:S1-C subfamily serine protease